MCVDNLINKTNVHNFSEFKIKEDTGSEILLIKNYSYFNTLQ